MSRGNGSLSIEELAEWMTRMGAALVVCRKLTDRGMEIAAKLESRPVTTTEREIIESLTEWLRDVAFRTTLLSRELTAALESSGWDGKGVGHDEIRGERTEGDVPGGPG
jgi:hypothetical protein